MVEGLSVHCSDWLKALLYIALIGVGSPVVLLNGSDVFLQLLQLLCAQFRRAPLDPDRWDGVSRIAAGSSREAVAATLGSGDAPGVLSEDTQTGGLCGLV